jgi:hypothetical protein
MAGCLVSPRNDAMDARDHSAYSQALQPGSPFSLDALGTCVYAAADSVLCSGCVAVSHSQPLGFASDFPKREIQLGVRLSF